MSSDKARLVSYKFRKGLRWDQNVLCALRASHNALHETRTLEKILKT